jgi:hypothetical protein
MLLANYSYHWLRPLKRTSCSVVTVKKHPAFVTKGGMLCFKFLVRVYLMVIVPLSVGKDGVVGKFW